MDIQVNRAAIYEAAEKLSNWGRWDLMTRSVHSI